MVGGLDTMINMSPDCQICKRAGALSIYPGCCLASPKQLIQKSCEDALAFFYKTAVSKFKNRIAVAGDSAGGNISTVVKQHAAGKSYTAGTITHLSYG